MNMYEFTAATGFQPDEDEYREIEAELRASGMSEAEFCRRWAAGGRPDTVLRHRTWKVARLREALAKERLLYAREIKRLMAELAAEREKAARLKGYIRGLKNGDSLDPAKEDGARQK